MLREHARTIRRQLALAERARGKGAEAAGYSLTACEVAGFGAHPRILSAES